MPTNTRHTVSSHKRNSLRSRALLAVAAAAVVGALTGSPLAAATPMPTAGAAQPAPSSSVPAAMSQGIIMRDGGICDPIRHMGC
jgi:hypothetical protein